MKKIWSSIIIMSLFIFIGIQILTERAAILESVTFSFSIWKNNIFPSLFPFFVLSEILMNYGFIELCGELLKPIMVRLFKTNSSCAFIFVMSIISGFPSNAKYTKELLEQGIIDEQEGTKILMFTCFSNPLFILGTVSILFLNNKEVGLLILLCHYIGNIIIGILFRNFYPTKEKSCSISFKKAISSMHQKRISNPSNFGQILTKALQNSISTLLLILGTVTTFLVITTIIDQNIQLNNYNQSILNGFVEMTQGLKYVSLLHIPLKLKSILTAMILSFGGLSVHMQVISIISTTKIKYFPFLVARVIHALLASFLVFFLFDFWVLLL